MHVPVVYEYIICIKMVGKDRQHWNMQKYDDVLVQVISVGLPQLSLYVSAIEHI